MQRIEKVDGVSFVRSQLTETTPGMGWVMTTRELPGSEVEPENYLKLAAEVAQKLGIPARVIGQGQQVHGDNIELVDNSNKPATVFPATDGLITLEQQTLLVLKIADCAAATVYDPQKRILGSVHSGWRSTASNIAGKLVRMIGAHGGSPESCKAVLAPCISKKFFEVGEDVISEFFSQPWLSELMPQREANGKYRLALAEIVRAQLQNEGMSPSNIELPTHCTYEDEELFYSWRRGNDAGRMLVLAWME